jgi:hypothetical protein
LELKAESSVQYKFFWRTYAGVLRRINFMDDQFFEIVNLRSPEITQNLVMFQYNVASALRAIGDGDRAQYVLCDGSFKKIAKKNASQMEKEFDTCTKAIAIDSRSIDNVVNLARYSNTGEIAVPISPFALSSLTATIAVYYVLLAKLIFLYVGSIFTRLMKTGDRLLQRHLFTMTSVVTMLLSVPIYLIAYELTK